MEKDTLEKLNSKFQRSDYLKKSVTQPELAKTRCSLLFSILFQPSLPK